MKITKENVCEVYKAICSEFNSINDIYVDEFTNLHICIAVKNTGYTQLYKSITYDETITLTSRKIKRIILKSNMISGFYPPSVLAKIFGIPEIDILLDICDTLVKILLKTNIYAYDCGGYEFNVHSKIDCLEELILNASLYPRESRAA